MNPRMQPLRASSNAKLERILESARKIFLARGYGATSMDAVAADAVVSKTTIYAMFNSKSDLFAAVLERFCDRMDESFSSAGEDTSRVRETLGAVGRSLLTAWLAPDALAFNRLLVAEVAQFPEIGRLAWTSGPGKMFEYLSAYLAKASRDGAIQIHDPDLAADLLLGMFQGLIFSRRILGIPDLPNDIDERIDVATEIFLLSFDHGDAGRRKRIGRRGDGSGRASVAGPAANRN